MIVTREMATRARGIIARWSDANSAWIPGAAQTRNVPLAIVTNLHARDHFDVNEWGEAIILELKRANRGVVFTIHIDGCRISARTDAPNDDVALAAFALCEFLVASVAPKTVTLDESLAMRAAELTAAAAK